MKSKLFSWENYKILDNLRVAFYACTLKNNIFCQGKATGWHGGAKIQEIELDYLNGTIRFFDTQDNERIILDEFEAEILCWERL